MGHSWAAGLQISADGKNQESSSEAVNAYLAIVELGKATGDTVLEGWGQVLLANEVTAARKYTQAYTGNDIYKQVGVVRCVLVCKAAVCAHCKAVR
jgi:endo-1,3(4)-beta-glucanase